MSDEELKQEIETICDLWQNIYYTPHSHDAICGYETLCGKNVVVFKGRGSGNEAHVYLCKNKNGQNILKPYFPKVYNEVRTNSVQ